MKRNPTKKQVFSEWLFRFRYSFQSEGMLKDIPDGSNMVWMLQRAFLRGYEFGKTKARR